MLPPRQAGTQPRWWSVRGAVAQARGVRQTGGLTQRPRSSDEAWPVTVLEHALQSYEVPTSRVQSAWKRWISTSARPRSRFAVFVIATSRRCHQPR